MNRAAHRDEVRQRGGEARLGAAQVAAVDEPAQLRGRARVAPLELLREAVEQLPRVGVVVAAARQLHCHDRDAQTQRAVALCEHPRPRQHALRLQQHERLRPLHTLA